MGFTKFVEIGRIVLINFGPDHGKLAVIVDVIDQNRAFIDGPESLNGVKRQSIPFRRISLTNFTIPIARGAGAGKILKELNKAEIQKKWAATSQAKKIAAHNKRASLNDFERFQVMLLRKQRSHITRTEFNKLKKAAAKPPAGQKKVAAAVEKKTGEKKTAAK